MVFLKKRIRSTVLLTCTLLMLTFVYTQPSRRVRIASAAPSGAQAARNDSARNARISGVEDVGKRVDSLQFIVVYNAELLRQDFQRKVIWVYVMLGVMIVGTMVLYGAFTQAQRQRKQLAEDLYGKALNEIAEIEGKFRRLEEEVRAQKAPPKKEPSRRRRKG
jgi:hypothetical protein